MAEYSKEQRNQLSRVIANSETGSRQLKGIVDNRKQNGLYNLFQNIQLKKEESCNNTLMQLSPIWSSKGNIIKSNELSVVGSDGKKNRGQIVGGKIHDSGTPGTTYAGNLKDVLLGDLKTKEDWKGGHLFKHQWGGGATAGNIVVWPGKAEQDWGENFEDNIDKIIQKEVNCDIAIGVSWLRDDELIQKDKIDLDSKVPYVNYAMENERRRVNKILSYVPFVVAGSYTKLGSDGDTGEYLIDSNETKVNEAVNSAITKIQSERKPKFENEEKSLKDKDFWPAKINSAKETYDKNIEEQNRMSIAAIRIDEEEHKGKFGNFTIE